jgi:hypothetical protein
MPIRLSVLQGAKLHIDIYPSWFGLLASAGHTVIKVGISIPIAISAYSTVKPI